MKTSRKLEVIPHQLADAVTQQILNNLQTHAEAEHLDEKLLQKLVKNTDFSEVLTAHAELTKLREEFNAAESALLDKLSAYSREFTESPPKGYDLLMYTHSLDKNAIEECIRVRYDFKSFDIYNKLIIEEHFNSGDDAQTIIDKVTQDCLNQLQSAVE